MSISDDKIIPCIIIVSIILTVCVALTPIIVLYCNPRDDKRKEKNEEIAPPPYEEIKGGVPPEIWYNTTNNTHESTAGSSDLDKKVEKLPVA